MAERLDLGKRPKCEICGADCQFVGTYRKDGSPRFRKLCGICHGKKIAEKRGLKNITEVIAQNAGFNSATEYLNSIHPYRKYRKTYCENIDGRLGYKCTTTIMIDAQLEVDHIDGDPSNHDESNLQTLCGCCHKYKTIVNEDYASPGRKALGITY